MTPKKLIILGVVKLVLIAVAAGVVYSMYGCDTRHGVGQDVQKAGESIQQKASDK